MKKKLCIITSLLSVFMISTVVLASVSNSMDKFDSKTTVATFSEAIKIATESEMKEEEIQTEILISDGFHEDQGGRYYIKDRKRLQNGFFLDESEEYHVGRDGYLTLGWFQDTNSNRWYFFDNDGKSQEKWIFTDGAWYYLEDGDYLTGWNQIGESGTWYCFSEDGKLYQDCMTSDGYLVDENGAYLEPQNSDEAFVWDKERQNGTISGLMIADYPAEFFMLSIAGETSGSSNYEAVRNGDHGCAYGLCQFDYRYDLVGFMEYAYHLHPTLWPTFESYLDLKNGDRRLKGNSEIGDAFIYAIEHDYVTAVTDQLQYIADTYWHDFKAELDRAGFQLDARNVAVSAALLSVNVNCGPQPSIFINNLSPDMTDEEMIREIYHIRNTILADQKVGNGRKGTTTRYLKAEPVMALDLLNGYMTIDSVVNYGGGVEWYGNPFSDVVSTASKQGKSYYHETVNAEELENEISDAELVSTPSEALQ